MQKRYNILNIVAYGAPVMFKGQIEGTLKRMGDVNDPVPYLSAETTIDQDISDLEAKIEENQTQQGLCGSDYLQLQQLQNQLQELEAQLEYKTERWIYLTDLKERIDAQGK